jgi:hypothetical protein
MSSVLNQEMLIGSGGAAAVVVSSENNLNDNINLNNMPASSTTTQVTTTNTTATTNTTSKFSSYVEFENQFILRMPMIKKENGVFQPHPVTIALREALTKANSNTLDGENGAETDPLKDRLFIDLNIDTRKGKIIFDNEIFEARLVDLPCIIESLKTTDKKTFYKSSDISQMLVCKTKDDPWSMDEDDSSSKRDAKNAAKQKKRQQQRLRLVHKPARQKVPVAARPHRTPQER